MTQPPSNHSYVADDGKITTAALEFLRTDAGERLLAETRARLAKGEMGVADVAALRRDFDAPAVHAAMTLVALQEKGRAKFPGLPFVWAVPEALEQATDDVVARHKAKRFAAAGVSEIVDLCAGIGGDTMALADVAPVTAVDLSPVRILCLQWNLESARVRQEVTAVVGDVRKWLEHTPLAGAAYHIDPSRRSGGKRSARWEDLIPGPPVLEPLIGHFHGGGIKLSSAVEFNTFPPGHLELISHRRVVVQAMLWTGNLAWPDTGSRTATVLHEQGQAFTFTNPPALPELMAEEMPDAGVLYEVDGALTRSGLAGPFAEREGLKILTTDGGYVWTEEPRVHPALVGFAIERVVPFSEGRVAKVLREMGGEPGVVEVKTRGGLLGVETDGLQKRWTKAAPYRRTVLVLKRGKEVMAAIGQRLR